MSTMKDSKGKIPFWPSCCSDNLILRLAKAAGEVLGKTHDELMYAFGVYMVKRIGNYGYERILKVFSFTNINFFLLYCSLYLPRDSEWKLACG